MAAEHHCLDVAHGDVDRLGEERAIPRRVEHTGHADDPLAWESRHLLRDVTHHVERIRHDDDDRVRRGALDLLRYVPDDSRVRVEQIITRHPRFARDAGGDDHDVGAARFVVAVGPDDTRIEALDGRRLPLIQPFPLRHPLDDVDHDDSASELLLRNALRGRRAHVPGANNRNLVDHVVRLT